MPKTLDINELLPDAVPEVREKVKRLLEKQNRGYRSFEELQALAPTDWTPEEGTADDFLEAAKAAWHEENHKS